MMSLVVTAARASAIAESSSAYVRAERARRNSLTLDQQFSIGEKSGEYGDKYTTVAPTPSITSRTPATLWAGRLSITRASPQAKDWVLKPALHMS